MPPPPHLFWPVLRVQVMEQALMLARTKDTGDMALAQALSVGARRLLHVICQSCELWQEALELPLYQLFGPEKDSGAVQAELRAHSAASAARALYSAGYHIGRVAHGLLCAGSASGDPDLARLFETAAVSVFTGCQLVLPDVAQLAIEAAAEMAAQAAQDIHDAQEEPKAAQDAQSPKRPMARTQRGRRAMARKRTLDDVLVELDGQLAAVGALPPARWLVICFELRQTGGAWEYRLAGERWGYSVSFEYGEERPTGTGGYWDGVRCASGHAWFGLQHPLPLPVSRAQPR